MRNLVLFSLIATLFTSLVACGQSGALMLPSDPNYDKRSQYILYPNPVANENTEQTTSQPSMPTPAVQDSN